MYCFCAEVTDPGKDITLSMAYFVEQTKRYLGSDEWHTVAMVSACCLHANTSKLQPNSEEWWRELTSYYEAPQYREILAWLSIHFHFYPLED